MTFLVRGDGFQECIQAVDVASIYDFKYRDASGDLRRLGNVLSSVSCIKDEWQFRRFGRQYCRSLLFDCGRKWIWRIASVWRAKLSGESELSAADVLRVSATRGFGHVWLGKLNRPPLPFGSRRGCEMSGEGGTSAGQNSSPSGMSYATRLKGDVCLSKGEEATWHFLRRIPQWDSRFSFCLFFWFFSWLFPLFLSSPKRG